MNNIAHTSIDENRRERSPFLALVGNASFELATLAVRRVRVQ